MSDRATQRGSRGGADPLWTKSPFVLRRFPGLAAALALGAMLLVLALSAYPLFISASESGLLTAQIESPTVTRYGAGMFYSRTNIRLTEPGIRQTRLVDEIGGAFERQTSRSPFLGSAVSYVFGPVVSVGTREQPIPSSGSNPGRLVTATDAVDHVTVISGEEGPGVWLPDLIADSANVGPGDRIVLAVGGRSVEVSVDGVYRSLYTQPPTGYWLRWSKDVYVDPICPDCPKPPQPILIESEQMLQLSSDLGQRRVTSGWLAPLRAGALTSDDAHDLGRSIEVLRKQMADPDDYLGKLFQCCGPRVGEQCCFFRYTTLVVSEISTVNTLIERRIEALQAPGRLLQGAGVLVALIVIAGAGAFAFAARRVESALLYSRGASAGRVAARSLLESLLPCLFGGVLGLAAAFFLVGTLGPEGTLSSTAWMTAMRGAALGIAMSLLLLGTVSAVSYLRQSEHHRARLGALTRMPWDMLIAVVSVFILMRLRAAGPSTLTSDPTHDVSENSTALLAFSVLFVAGFGSVTARAFGALMTWIRKRSGRLSPAPYLAVHRLAGGRKTSVLLVAASALCLGIFVQSQVMVGSLRSTVDAKAKVYVGSDVQGRMDHLTPTPEALAFPFTRVTRLPNAGDLPGGSPFDLLAVDRATFAAAAYWNEAFAPSPLADLLGGLGWQDRGSIPAIVVRDDGFTDQTPVEIQKQRLSVRVVAHVSAFPGMTSLRPMLVVDEDVLRRVFAGTPDPLLVMNSSSELWVRGDAGLAIDALERTRYPPYLILSAEEVKDIPLINAVIDTFLVLNTLGLAAALLVLAAMLMYLQARQRSQIVSYGLSLRMGMSHERHRRALVLELGSMLGASYVVGVVVAIVAAAFVVPMLDPLATIPPAPLFVTPAALLGMSLASILFAAWLGGWYTNVRAGRADLGEVMRLAE